MNDESSPDRSASEAGKSEERSTGTFLVTHADEGSAVLRDVANGQVHTLGENPGVEAGEVLEATIEPEPPLGVTWRVDEIEDRRTIELIDSDLSPTQWERELAAEREPGEIQREERAGTGEIHVLSVPEGNAEATARNVLDDDETLARAARLDVVRVEVRRCEGVVSVRYLPN